jgi:hypothetical protein
MMSDEMKLNRENEEIDEHVRELHNNTQPTNAKLKGKEAQAPKRSFSPFSIIGKAIPLAFGIATFAILLTVVIYFLLK